MQVQKMVTYTIVGVLTAIVYLLLGYLLSNHIEFSPVASASIAYVMAVIFNYTLHYKYTFRSSSSHIHSLPKYIASIGLGFIINALVVDFSTNQLNISQIPSQLSAMFAVIVTNFFVFNFWVFNSNNSTNKK